MANASGDFADSGHTDSTTLSAKNESLQAMRPWLSHTPA